MKAIVFGSKGQDGYYLKLLLKQNGIDAIGISRSQNDIVGNVQDYDFVKDQLLKYRPSFVFHLAANSTTHHDAIFENHQTICTGTLNILEAARLYCPHSKVFISGSAMQFKNLETPINESTPFDASSPYSIARIQSVYAARYFREKFKLKVYVGYFFNHDSPLRSERHVNQKIVKSVKRIVAGSREKLTLGNINVKKEFNYAGDVVEAIWILVNQSDVFEAVIGSGVSYSIKEWLAYCFGKVGLNWQDHTIINSDYIAEYNNLVSDPSLIKSMGWKPKVDITGLADLMFEADHILVS